MEELLLLHLYCWNKNRKLSLAITCVKHVSSETFLSRSIVAETTGNPKTHL